MKKEQPQCAHPVTDKYDYLSKYPADEQYHELDENARVWRRYLNEAATFDNEVVEELGDSLDISLIFAGLFSAVLTTFVAQTSQSLSQDYTQLSALYLAELTLLARASTNSTALANVPVTNASFSVTNVDLWVNALWFTSLTVALVVALTAVLAKQWLRQYLSMISGSPKKRALIRQFRYEGLQQYHVQGIIRVLPVLLHLSLLLFLIGLVLYLQIFATLWQTLELAASEQKTDSFSK
ncbi:hypothetical protein GG344DRAFT_91030 [Lentinula edodes]|nr:hypothetical protein GG344DRAFT_91030 [Lentinula edodes]